MSSPTFSALLLVLVSSAAQANWETYVAPEDSPWSPGRAAISYNPYDGDIPTFRGAIEQLRDLGHLDRLEMITIHGATIEPHFQQELIEALETHAPREFAEARASAANTHKPTPEALHDVFEDVVLQMPMIQRLDAELGEFGRRISRVSHEKLSLFDRDGELVIIVMLWLSVEPA